MSPETMSYFEKLEDDDLSKLKFKLYVSDKSIESYQKENEQLKEKLKAYESDEIVDFENCSKEQLSAENVQYFKEIEKLKIENKELIKENDILNKIIYAFVVNNYRYDEEEGYWIALDNSTFQCDSTARQAFISIINQIKEKFNNENNN